MVGSKTLVFDRPLQGHFRRGVEVVSRVLNAQSRLSMLRHAWPGLITWRGPLVLNSSNSYLKAFLVIALVRHLLGRRTVGIMTRDPRAYRRLWNTPSPLRAVLEFVFSRSRVRILSIMVPCERNAAMGEWIYDIEWWDLKVAPLPERATPPCTVLFLGDVNSSKGLDFFIEAAQAAAAHDRALIFTLLCDLEELPASAAEAFQAAGGRILPRTDDDTIFVNHMRHADWIWCCYRPPRDWSSGLFGRALQLGKRTIVRQGTYIECFQKQYGRGVSIEYGNVEALLHVLINAGDDKEKPPAPIAEFSKLSISRLKDACGLQTQTPEPEAGQES